MLSKRAKYGLLALIALARRGENASVLIAELAEAERIPKKFLELILLDLKNHGLLHSKKGRGGGYYLGRSPKAITLGSVIRILDGPLAPLPCVSQTAYRKCEECIDEETCGIRLVMKDVREAVAKVLDSATLADVVERTESATNRILANLTYSI